MEQTSEKLLVRPERPVTPSIARISFDGDRLRCYFPEKRDAFWEVMRDRSLYWEPPFYTRKISGDETRRHRAAELAHHLLATGFCVKVETAVMQMAISQTYDPEPRRVVTTVNGKKHQDGEYAGWFLIWWHHGEDCYDAAKRLPGARYSRPNVVVPPESFAEVLDFAGMYQFQVAPQAQALADKAQAEQDAALIVSLSMPLTPKLKRQPPKPPKLTVPKVVDIDDELLDDD